MPVFKKILDSQRGGKILIDQEGYLYNYLRETSKGSTWSCRAKYKLKCATRIYYTSGKSSSDIEMTVEHNHPPKHGQARAIEVMRKFKKGDHQKLSYKVRKELALLEFETDDVTIDDLPTLLRKRKTLRRRLGNVVENVTTSTDEADTIVDVETNVPAISSTSQEFGLNEDLQDAIEQLLNEPELLQLLINSLMESQEAQGQNQDPEMMEATLIQRERVRNALSPEIQILSSPNSLTDIHPDTQPFAKASILQSEIQAIRALISHSPPLECTEFSNLTESHNFSTAADLSSYGQNQQSGFRFTTLDTPHSSAIPILAIQDDTQQNLHPDQVNKTVTSLTLQTNANSQLVFEGSHTAFDDNRKTAVIMTTSEGQFIPTSQIVSSVGEASTAQLLSKLVPLPVDACTLVLAPPALNKPFCHQCQTLFTDPEQLDIHFNTLKCCKMCKMAFCVQGHYDKHMELNHPDGKKSAWGVLCESCGRVFGVMFQLDAHRIKCANRRSLRCSRCFYSYGFDEDLNRHKLTHANIFPFECIDCTKTWPTISGLQKHQALKRTEGKASPHKCTLCTKRCCTKQDYYKHMTVNHSVDGRNKKQEAMVASSGSKETPPDLFLKMNRNQICILPAPTLTRPERRVCTFCKERFPGQRALLEHEAKHLSLCGLCGGSNCAGNCAGQQLKASKKGRECVRTDDISSSNGVETAKNSNVCGLLEDELSQNIPLSSIVSDGKTLISS